MAKTVSKKKVSDAIWSGIGFGLGAAIFVPLFNMLLAKVGVKFG